MKHGYNALTVEQHLLVCLAEECGELMQAISKALRFGTDDDYDLKPPIYRIQREWNDLIAVSERLEAIGFLRFRDEEMISMKNARLDVFMEYAYKKRTLGDYPIPPPAPDPRDAGTALIKS